MRNELVKFQFVGIFYAEKGLTEINRQPSNLVCSRQRMGFLGTSSRIRRRASAVSATQNLGRTSKRRQSSKYFPNRSSRTFLGYAK